MSYFSGQGKVYAAQIDLSGNVLGYTALGNCSALSLNLGKNYVRDAAFGPWPAANGVRPSDPPTFTLVMEDMTSANMQTLLYGQNNSFSGTVTAEVVVGYVGKMTPLVNMNLSSFTTLKNQALSTTYVKNTDYTVDLSNGTISIPATGSAITDGQILSAAYVYNTYTKVGIGTSNQPFFALRFEGLNTANTNSAVIVDMYKTKLYPLESLILISDQINQLQVNGRMFKNQFMTDTRADGLYMRIKQA